MFKNKELKVLNFTHIDLDGATSAIVVSNYYGESNVRVEQINYTQEIDALNKIIELKDEFDCVVFTDFTPYNIMDIKAVGIPVLVLDHHKSVEKFNNPNENIFIDTRFCGAKVAFNYYYPQGNDKLKELVDITNDYDLFTLEDERSLQFNHLMHTYGFDVFVNRFMNGDIELMPLEVAEIINYINESQKQLEKVEIKLLSNNGAYFKKCDYMTEVVIGLLKKYDWLVIEMKNELSLRLGRNDISLVDVCNKVGKGGGHPKSAGCPLECENPEDLLLKIVLAYDSVLKGVK